MQIFWAQQMDSNRKTCNKNYCGFFFLQQPYFHNLATSSKKTIKSAWWQKIWWMHLIPRSLLLLSSVHLCFLIVTLFAPLVMISGHYEQRSEVHCYCRRSSRCCQLEVAFPCFDPSHFIFPSSSSAPHQVLSNFVLGSLIPQKQSLSRGAKELPAELAA